MCHWGADVNMSLSCQPYLTIPTKIRTHHRTNSSWHRKRGRWSRKSRWQHRCIIHLFIIPCFSPHIIPSPQKTACPLFSLSLQISFVGVLLRWSSRERGQLEFRSHSVVQTFCVWGQLDTTLNIDKLSGQQVGSCTPLSHRQLRESMSMLREWEQLWRTTARICQNSASLRKNCEKLVGSTCEDQMDSPVVVQTHSVGLHIL